MFHNYIVNINVRESQSHKYTPLSLFLSTAGSDYIPLMEMVTFGRGVTQLCVDILIVNDNTPDPLENFIVEISPSDDVVPGPPALVNILDDGQWEAPV